MSLAKLSFGGFTIVPRFVMVQVQNAYMVAALPSYTLVALPSVSQSVRLLFYLILTH